MLILICTSICICVASNVTLQHGPPTSSALLQTLPGLHVRHIHILMYNLGKNKAVNPALKSIQIHRASSNLMFCLCKRWLGKINRHCSKNKRHPCRYVCGDTREMFYLFALEEHTKSKKLLAALRCPAPPNGSCPFDFPTGSH